MSGLLLTEPFVAVFPDLVRRLGSMEAAALLQFIAYQEDDGEGVTLTVAAMAEGTGLTDRTVKRLTARLRTAGVLQAERSGPWCSTLRYQVCRDHPVLAGQQESARVASSESAKVAPRQSAKVSPSESASLAPSTVLPEVEESPEHTAVAVEADDQPLDGILLALPETPSTAPPQTAQTLVARWVDGYRASNGGQDPPGPLMKRVAGQAKNLAKACETDADWGAAWRASYAAGQGGHADAVPYMAQARSRYGPRNYDLERMVARNAGQSATVSGPAALAISMLGGASS
jgi:hypothetical protein